MKHSMKTMSKKMTALGLAVMLGLQPAYALPIQTQTQDETAEAYTAKIYFSPNGGTGSMEKQTITSTGFEQLSKNTFTRNGFTFRCWNTESDGAGDEYADEAVASALADEYSDGTTIKLYAQWTLNPVSISGIKASSLLGCTISFERNPSASGCEIEYDTDDDFSDPENVKVGKSKTSATLKQLDPGKTYYIRIRSYRNDSYNDYTSEWSEPQTYTVNNLAVPSIQSCKKRTWDQVRISYKSSQKPDRFELQCSSSKNFKPVKKLTLDAKTKYVDVDNLVAGKKYYARIRAVCDGSKKKYYSNWSAVKTFELKKPTAIKIKSCKTVNPETIQVTYAKTKNATDYVVEYSTSKKFKPCKRLKLSNWETSASLSVIPGKTYYVRAGYNCPGASRSVSSNWSAVKTVNVPKISAPKINALTTPIRGEAKITYSEVKMVSGYEIQYSTNHDFSSAQTHKVNDTNTTSQILPNTTPGCTYFVRIRSFYVGSKKTRYSAWSDTKQISLQGGSVISNTPSKTAIEADVTLTGSGSGFHAKFVVGTATSAVSFGIQYDACAIAPYTGKAMAMVENVASNNPGGQQYFRPGNRELHLGQTYHMMLTIDDNGNGSVYLDYEKIGDFSNPGLAGSGLYLRVEGSARVDGDHIDASFRNIRCKTNGSYDPNKVWSTHEFNTNPTIHSTVHSNDDISISGYISGLGAGNDWDNRYGSVSDIIQFIG